MFVVTISLTARKGCTAALQPSPGQISDKHQPWTASDHRTSTTISNMAQTSGNYGETCREQDSSKKNKWLWFSPKGHKGLQSAAERLFCAIIHATRSQWFFFSVIISFTKYCLVTNSFYHFEVNKPTWSCFIFSLYILNSYNDKHIHVHLLCQE